MSNRCIFNIDNIFFQLLKVKCVVSDFCQQKAVKTFQTLFFEATTKANLTKIKKITIFLVPKKSGNKTHQKKKKNSENKDQKSCSN